MSIGTAAEIELFFDGDCPLCAREVRVLRRLNSPGRIKFTDIANPAFDPGKYGKDRGEFASTIHARLHDGGWITGFEVFRRLYAAVGFGVVVKMTRLPGVAQLLEAAYRWFAANRLRLTGRCDEQSCSGQLTGKGSR